MPVMIPGPVRSDEQSRACDLTSLYYFLLLRKGPHRQLQHGKLTHYTHLAVQGHQEKMSHRTALNKDLIMRRVAERQPTPGQAQTALSTFLITDPHERLGTRFIAVSSLADVPAFPRQVTHKHPRCQMYALSKPDITSSEP
jgi:hypothetical protein